MYEIGQLGVIQRGLYVLVNEGVDEVQVMMINRPVMRSVAIGWVESLVLPLQYPPPHGPLLRTGFGAVVVYLFLEVQDDSGEYCGSLSACWGLVYHLWGPKIFPLVQSPPSPQGTRVYHHDAGSPRCLEPCR
jgi:hypothetical protein